MSMNNTIRDRSTELGARLADKQKAMAWPNAVSEDMPYVITDAIANLLVFASEAHGESIDTILDRARMHADAELGEEGEMPA